MKKYMVIESFFPGCKDRIYERFRRQGRMLPDGLVYVNSWLEKDGDRCFQLMETNEPSLFQMWFEHWKDLMAIEIVELGESRRCRVKGKRPSLPAALEESATETNIDTCLP